jgi:lipid A 3-O-deacylase
VGRLVDPRQFSKSQDLIIKFELSKDLKYEITALLALGISAIPGLAQAEADWGSFTLDNDTFIGEDQGYTNGLYYTWYDTPDNNKAKPGFLARAMLWSLADADEPLTLSANTIGQTMSTPGDITIPDPPLDDLPYAGLLFYSDSFISVHDSYADKIGVTIGDDDDIEVDKYSQYGTLTIAWRH